MTKLAEQAFNDLVDALVSRTTATTSDIVGLIDDREQKADALLFLLCTVLGQHSAQMQINCLAETGENLELSLAAALGIKKVMKVLSLTYKELETIDFLLKVGKEDVTNLR